MTGGQAVKLQGNHCISTLSSFYFFICLNESLWQPIEPFAEKCCNLALWLGKVPSLIWPSFMSAPSALWRHKLVKVGGAFMYVTFHPCDWFKQKLLHVISRPSHTKVIWQILICPIQPTKTTSKANKQEVSSYLSNPFMYLNQTWLLTPSQGSTTRICTVSH